MLIFTRPSTRRRNSYNNYNDGPSPLPSLPVPVPLPFPLMARPGPFLVQFNSTSPEPTPTTKNSSFSCHPSPATASVFHFEIKPNKKNGTIPPAMAEQDGNAATPSALALFASRLSYRRYYAAAARLPQPTCRTQPRDLCDLFAHLSTSLPPPLTGCECAAGSGTRTSGCWRPRCPPALTSPRCSPRARRPGVCFKQARRRRSHPLRRVQCWMVGAASSSPTSSHAPSRS